MLYINLHPIGKEEPILLVVKFQQSREGVEVQKSWYQNGAAPSGVTPW